MASTTNANSETEANVHSDIEAHSVHSQLVHSMNEFLNSSCSSHKINHLNGCIRIIETCEQSSRQSLLEKDQFVQKLRLVIEAAYVPPFMTRDYFSYEREDFIGYPELSECVFKYLMHLFNADYHHPLKITDGNIDSQFAQLLLTIIIFIGAHAKEPQWSLPGCQTMHTKLLQLLLSSTQFDSPCEVLLLKASYTTENTSKSCTMLEHFLMQCKQLFQKGQWQRHPFYVEAFCWIITQVKSPYLSEHIEMTMITSLNFLEDHQETNKIKGINCIQHLIDNTSGEELRWYNRAEVIYEALKKQMFNKEPAVVASLFPCLFSILKVVDKKPDLEYHNSIMITLMQYTILENLLVIRRLYVNFLNDLIQQIGVATIQHLKTLVSIVEQFLEIEDGEEELSRIGVLKMLYNLIRIAWPRIPHHTQKLLKAILKLLVDINSSQYQKFKTNNTQEELNELSVKCMKLLLKLSPSMKEALEALMESEHLTTIRPVLARVSND